MNIKYSIREKGIHWKYSVVYEYFQEEKTVGAYVKEYGAFRKKLYDKLQNSGVQSNELHRFIFGEEYSSRWGWNSHDEIEIDEQDIPRIKEVLQLLRSTYDETLEEALNEKQYHYIFTFDPDFNTLDEIQKLFTKKGLRPLATPLFTLKIDKDWGFQDVYTTIDIPEELNKIGILKAPYFLSDSLRVDFYRKESKVLEISYPEIESRVKKIIEKEVPGFIKHFATVIHNLTTFQPIHIQDTIALDQEQKEILRRKGDSEPLCSISYLIEQKAYYDGQPTIEAYLDLSDDELEWLAGRTIHSFTEERNSIQPLRFSETHIKIPMSDKALTCPEVVIAFLKAYQNKVVKSLLEHAPTERKPLRRKFSGNIEMSPETKERLAPLLIEVKLTK